MAAVTVKKEETDALAAALLAHPEFKKQFLTPVQEALQKANAPARSSGMTAASFMNTLAGPSHSSYISPDGVARVIPHGSLKKRRVGYCEKSNPMTGQREMAGHFGSYLKALYHWNAPPHITTEKNRGEAGELLKSWGVEKIYRRGDEIYKTALAESSGVTGGYSVPPMFAEVLMTLAAEEALIQKRATNMPLTSRTLLVPSLDITTAQAAGVTAFLGGIQAQWTSEAALRAEFEPQFRQTELTAWELSFISIASNTLLQDEAVGLDQLLTQLFGLAIGWFTDFAFFQGNGVGKPLGILNAPATLSVTHEASSKFTWFDATAMMAKIWSMLLSNDLCWFMHQSVLPQLLRMNDDSGTSQTGRVLYVPINQGAQAGLDHPDGPQSVGYLLGKPVYLTEKLPALGTLGCVLLADLSKYLIGTRMDLEIDVSPHYKFANNQLTWRVVARVDGQPWLNNPVTLADGSQQVSPFVVLN